jgi:glycosyltransferase involved in cell wall biosynthesis
VTNLSLLEKLDDVRLAGHPYSPTGRGEDVRCTLRALNAVGASPKVFDIFAIDERSDASITAEVEGRLTDKLGPFNIFHINGAEIEQVVSHIGGLPSDSFNVIYPAWELPNYPDKWARQLEWFDEIWAPSQFIEDSISKAVAKPVVHMPLACEPKMRFFVGRDHFGIPASAFAFLFFFDFTSFLSRKNPFAVIEAFERAMARCGETDACLVIKLNRGLLVPADYARFKSELQKRRARIILLDGTYSDNQTKNLVRCCDAFVSLHRSEGFGRGLAEAMILGKPVIGTGWSGNLDFMNTDIACLVDNRLIPLQDGEYPYAEGQVWADPDVEQAAEYMVRMIKAPQWAAELGRRASRYLRINLSFRARGLAYATQILVHLASRLEAVRMAKVSTGCERLAVVAEAAPPGDAR